MGVKIYSEQDKEILDYFFTSTDKPVFATKNFHPEVWALMQARYSRSTEGLRQSFLKLLKEDISNFDQLYEEIKKTSGGIHSKNATEKAIQFMERWVLGYGHSSIAEGAVIGLGIEGVSILATKVIEDNRLSSFIEKSTRYVSFDENSFYIDQELESSPYINEIKELLDLLFKTYMKLHEPVLEYVKKQVPYEKNMTKPAWERACAARRFDAIRYLLPACTKTSLGWTVNARQLSHAITKLLSHPLKEMNQTGEMIKEEGKKVLPSLLKYADKNKYISETNEEMQSLSYKTEIEDEPQPDVVLVKTPENHEDMIIASILYKYKKQPFKNIIEKVKTMSNMEKEKILDKYLENMGKFDWPMRELEHAYFTFDIIIDFGAFRDLQRHRICTQTNQLLTTELGYDIPEDIVNAGCKEKYIRAMEKAKQLYEKIRKNYPLQAQYIVPLGFKKRYLLTMNLREIYHIVKLRTTPLAHTSYRKIAYKIYEIMKKHYPLLSKYIICNYSEEELGRLRSEEATEKLEKVRPL